MGAVFPEQKLPGGVQGTYLREVYLVPPKAWASLRSLRGRGTWWEETCQSHWDIKFPQAQGGFIFPLGRNTGVLRSFPPSTPSSSAPAFLSHSLSHLLLRSTSSIFSSFLLPPSPSPAFSPAFLLVLPSPLPFSPSRS